MAVSFVKDLPPPEAEDEDDSTWDSTFQREVYRKSPVGSNSICRHAVSVGSRVYGIAHKSGGDDDTDDSLWTTWQTSLVTTDTTGALSSSSSSSGSSCSPPVGLVNAITSNADGSVIVAATDTGIVSLMRGSDGQVLATRKVCSYQEEDASIHLSWITDAGSTDNDEDVLLIEANGDEATASTTTTTLILVSNIRGKLLNHENPAVVAEAARNMQMQHVVPLGVDNDYSDLRAITGSFLQNSTTTATVIRLVACDCEGKLVVFDYDLQEKKTSLVKSGISFGRGGGADEDEDEWIIDFDVGLSTQTCDNGRSFVVCSAFSKHAPMIFWFDPVSLQAACQFEVPQAAISSSSKARRSKVISIEPVHSYSNSDTLAIAVSEKTSLEESKMLGTIHVIQVLIDETMGLTLLRDPHVVYTIPTEAATVSVAMAGIPSVGGTILPYSFRYKLWSSGADDCDYKEFVTTAESSAAIGKIRSLLARGDFDQADEIITMCGLDSLSNDPYAQFHPSEVALHRLTHSLQQGSPEAIEQAQQCLRRLASGAVTGKEKGLRLFLEAVNCITRSPSSLSMENFILGLTALTSTIQNVIDALSSQNTDQLQAKQMAIDNQISALKFLSSLNANASDTSCVGYQLDTPFHKIRSPSHLFSVLVQERKFALAHVLYRSTLKGKVTAESLILPILKLRADVSPNDYLSLLNEVALPNLTINHHLLSRLRGWARRVADELDDVDLDQKNLDGAILLLKTVDKGSRELQLQIHSSFGSFTPFVPLECRQSRRSPCNSSVHPDMSSSGEFTFLFGSSASKTQQGTTTVLNSQNSIPTILELGAMKRGAAISKLDLQRPDDDDDYDGNEDCVKKKLTEAQCLRKARELGLDRGLASLRNFEQKGGAQYVAKELVRLFSSRATCHEARCKIFSDSLQCFCETFDVCADHAMLECTVDLCRGKNISERAIEESCSIARCCSSVIVRCNVALTVLRAALLCGTVHSDLALLSTDAIAWASCDSSLQSELEEASRLLQIDSIVVKYCGFEARELFRVDNPRHAVRLLDFVSKHVDTKTVIVDSLSLCDAFHHLSPCDATRRLFQNAIIRGDSDRCVSLLAEIIQKDVLLAGRSLIGALSFAEEVLAECSNAIRSESDRVRRSSYQQRSRHTSSCAGALILCAMENSLAISPDVVAEIDCYLDDTSLESLRDAFLRIERLECEHSVFISLAEYNSTEKLLEKAVHFVEDVAAACHEVRDPNLLNMKLTTTKKACCLLSGGFERNDLLFAASVKVANAFVKENQDGNLLDFLFDVGLLTDARSDLTSRAHLSIASSLCLEAANSAVDSSCVLSMQRVVKAASILRDWSVMVSGGKELSIVVKLAGHLDVITEVFARADEGIGESIDTFRQSLQSRAWARNAFVDHNERPMKQEAINIMHRPPLHSSWYIGDGLLLPPNETLSRCLRFCRGFIDAGRGMDDGSIALYQLVGSRGAHSVALRTLCLSAALRACSGNTCTHDPSFLFDLQDALSDTVKSLAERSLGGTGSGITSAVIDSQHAVSFLLSLPIKQAFEAYRSCLPTAVKTKAFNRVVTLANVGMLAGSGDSMLGESGIFVVGWQRQHKFFEQCRELAAGAQWLAILKKYGVEFETTHFEGWQESGIDSSVSKDAFVSADSKYAASLLLPMIAKLSKVHATCEVLRLCTLYANAFGLQRDLVIQRHVEFLLAPADINNDGLSGMKSECDCRINLALCEKTVRASLLLLRTPLLQSAVLRRCLIALDGSETSGQDYERYALVLSLYQETLTHVVDRQDLTIRSIDPAPYETELELIDRRRDALAILSSYFQGDRLKSRPSFSKFFVPLRVPFNDASSVDTETKICGILGYDGRGTFDPLQPLDNFFSASVDTAAVTALAPLCMPLGLPQGFIHARSLIARFHFSSTNKVAYPSVDNDVTPVMNRIRSPQDKTVLAEWCTKQYEGNDNEKLKCLSVVLQSAIQASTEIEQRRRHFPKDKALEKLEIEALETVKRITSAKAALSDTLRVKTILSSADSSVRKIANVLIAELDGHIQSNPDMSPESLIDFLHGQGSLLSANASLDSETCFSVTHFRQFCSIVHSACHAVAEQHSHIHPDRHARQFCQRWLFYGDEATTGPSQISMSIEPCSSTVLPDIREEDTMNFVMDLSGIQSTNDHWGSVAGDRPYTQEKRMVCDEEGSALLAKSSREVSEAASQRAALRIAFVMAFSEDDNADSGESSAKENHPSNKMRNNSTKRLGLLAKLDSRRDSKRDNKVFDHGSELLRIVFAKSGISSNLISRWHSFDSSDTSVSVAKKEAPKNITFAMRHRALRAASILCPQEALEEIIHGEGYLRSNGIDDDCSFHQCAFGAFLAKEIEEMGLPLPHSDLGKISSMGFLSYARALWRHHRDHSVEGSKGRLLLLLTELSLRGEETDPSFVSCLLDEMVRLNLPRSILLALERIAAFENRSGASHLTGNSISKALASLAQSILSEVHHVLTADTTDKFARSGAMDTLERLCKIAAIICHPNEITEHLAQFKEVLMTFSSANNKFAEKLLGVCNETTERARICSAQQQVQIESD